MRILIGRSVGFSIAVLAILVSCSPPATQDAGHNDVADVPFDAPADVMRAMCTTDRDCDDTVFCNGAERCMPGAMTADRYGCTNGPAPACMPSQHCNEMQERCETVCAVEPDADGDGHQALGCGGDDCDDNDAHRFPGNEESCDALGRDEDCDATTFGHRDLDLDTYDDVRCCNTARDGAMHCGTDCNDQVRAIHPLATEVCNLVDDNCDGMTDEGATIAGFADADHDLHGDTAHPLMACPGAVGFATLGDDCDDHNPARNPTQVEICDAVDNDCNGMVDDNTRAVTWYADADGDGFGSAASGTTISCAIVPGSSLLASDCDDMHRTVNPGAAEQCDGLDNDCNGLADFVIGPNNLEDDDADGAPDIACPRLGTDCDDRDLTVHPHAAELCDGRDNDCDGMVDNGTGAQAFYLDMDGDGFGDMAMPPMMSCTPIAGRITRGGDCDDTNPHRHPGVDDPCDAIDDDCDGDTDEDSTRFAYYTDVDRDGYGAGTPTLACIAPSGLAAFGGDCADTDATRHPGASELCNAADDDCDGVSDNGASQVFHVDMDRDGYGVPGGATMIGCVAPAGWAPNTTDCDDARAAVHPTAAETCNGTDDDCDGMSDEEPTASASCTAANANSTCTSGVCAITSCISGFLDCDGTTTNGCETPSNTSSNCGACGSGCVRLNAAATCASGTCDYSSCVLGFGDCDSNRMNGCETSLRTATNCGTCGQTCPAGASCLGGSCVCPGVTPLVCGSGASASCTDSAQDKNNCGACGTVCTVACASSACITATMAGGLSANCAVLSNGTARCWGLNSGGQLGDGTTTSPRTLPRAVSLPSGSSAVQAAIGGVGCAVFQNQTVWCWGTSPNGELGTGTTMSSYVPTQVSSITNAVQIATGTNHSCARLSTGQVMCWGYNLRGQVGDGTSITRYSPVSLSLTNVTQVSIGPWGSTSCALHADGTVHCWGEGGSGEVGDGATGSHLTPSLLGLSNIVQIAQGGTHTCARDSSGAVFCWGANANGELATGATSANRLIPASATVFSGPVSVVAAGNGSTCAVIAATHTVECIGSNASGQLGDGTTTNRTTAAVAVTGLSNVASIVAGDNHYCATDLDGTVRCWGANNVGQIGDGTTSATRTAPTRVSW